MSAGTGVAHSEFNASKTETVHLYQIWMFPDKQGYTPAYDQKNFSDAEKRGKLRLVVSPDGREGSVKIRQDNELYATVLGAGDSVKHEPALSGMHITAHAAARTRTGNTLETGDGQKWRSAGTRGVREAEVLLFDLAGPVRGKRQEGLTRQSRAFLFEWALSLMNFRRSEFANLKSLRRRGCRSAPGGDCHQYAKNCARQN
jgi:redox-sensitive bicupin YhaK (pirin superfamily)